MVAVPHLEAEADGAAGVVVTLIFPAVEASFGNAGLRFARTLGILLTRFSDDRGVAMDAAVFDALTLVALLPVAERGTFDELFHAGRRPTDARAVSDFLACLLLLPRLLFPRPLFPPECSRSTRKLSPVEFLAIAYPLLLRDVPLLSLTIAFLLPLAPPRAYPVELP